MKKTEATKATANESAVDKEKRERRKRSLVDFGQEPDEPNWRLSGKDWKRVGDECDLEFDEEVIDALCDSVNHYFLHRDIELSAVNRAEVRAFLTQVGEAAAALTMLLNAKKDAPAITATRDVLRAAIFDQSSPLLKAHNERSPEPAHEAVFSFDDFDDVTGHLGRLIDGAADIMASNAATAKEIAASANESAGNNEAIPPKLSAWDTMACEIAQTLEGAGFLAVASSNADRYESSLVRLMLALTRRMPDKYQQHFLGDDRRESSVAMAGAINKARSADRKRRDAIAAAKARKSSGDVKKAKAQS